MCKFMSFLVVPGGVLWELTTNSHENLIRRYGLNDTQPVLVRRGFVRVENVPTDKGWIYTVDEQGTLPAWYTKNEATHRARVLRASQEKLRGLRARCAAREDLSGANLSDADMSDTDLSGASLSDTDLSRADLSNTNLSHADLSGANLSRADLSHASLSHADLSGADLSDTDLSDTDLSGANLYGANLSRANLSDILRDNATIL